MTHTPSGTAQLGIMKGIIVSDLGFLGTQFERVGRRWLEY
jgi:hypothetical protein